MKQKISPVGSIIVLIVVIAVVGTLLYKLTEPPLVNVPKKSEAQMVKDGQAGMAGFKAMFEGAHKKAKDKPDAKIGRHAKDGADDKAQDASTKVHEIGR